MTMAVICPFCSPGSAAFSRTGAATGGANGCNSVRVWRGGYGVLRAIAEVRVGGGEGEGEVGGCGRGHYEGGSGPAKASWRAVCYTAWVPGRCQAGV